MHTKPQWQKNGSMAWVNYHPLLKHSYSEDFAPSPAEELAKPTKKKQQMSPEILEDFVDNAYQSASLTKLHLTTACIWLCRTYEIWKPYPDSTSGHHQNMQQIMLIAILTSLGKETRRSLPGWVPTYAQWRCWTIHGVCWRCSHWWEIRFQTDTVRTKCGELQNVLLTYTMQALWVF